MIDDLDGFAQWLNNEASMGRIPRRDAIKIIRSIDIVCNAIEDYGY